MTKFKQGKEAADRVRQHHADEEQYELPEPDVTPATHPDHHTVGKEFMGHDYRRHGWPAVRWFCESHDRCGYWMYATDGSGHWTNVSERAIGRSFHEIERLPSGRLICAGWRVPTYT